jgi:VWFA-related protein
MMRDGLAVAVLGGLAVCAGTVWAQTQGRERVRIVSPQDESYLIGETMLRADVAPVEDARSVVFYVDGRQVCTLTQAPFECAWDAGSDVEAHQVRVVATFGSGRRIVQTTQTEELGYTENVDVDIVQVTATVTDGRGNFIRGLPRSAFHVFEDGQPQRISHFESEDVPLDLLTALDISSSMTAAMPTLKEAAKAFLTAVPSKDRVTLLGFNDRIFTLTRGTTDPAERVASVERLAPWGGTALHDVILRGVDMLGRQPGRKALVVFTDGDDQGSRASRDEVARRLQVTDATLYMIGQGRGVSMDDLKRQMQRLAAPTGGRALAMQKIDELHRAFADILEELSNQYLLGYAPTNSKRDDTVRKIRVEVDGRHSVRARTEYRAAPRRGR